MKYIVFVDDNYHFMDESARCTHGEFETLEAAVDAAKKIVDDDLLQQYEPGMTPTDLYGRYKMFGDDPWIVGEETNPFSAWEYAKVRCEIMCAASAA